MNVQFSPARLRELRLAQGITQQDVADRTGCSRRTYINWERGVIDPRIHALGPLAHALDITLGELFV